MVQSAISISPLELAALRDFVKRLGRHGEPFSVEGLRLLGRASDIVPTAVHRDDDILLFQSLEGALVIGAVRDDGGVTYARMDNANNLRVTMSAVVVNTLITILASMTDLQQSTDAARAELTKMTSGLAIRSILNEPARQATAEQQPVSLVGTRQGHLLNHDLGILSWGVMRKYVGVDAGAYVSPVAVAGPTDTTSTVTFTGVLLVGRLRRIYNATDDMFHTVTAAVDPAGGAVGTLTVTPAIPSANAVLRIPFSATPPAWNSATDATQTLAVAAPPKGANGPAVLLSSAALVEVAASYDIDVPVANYDQISVGVYIDAAAGDTYQIDLYARIDDQAAGDWHIVNTQFTASGATALGAPADPCELIACVTNRRMFRELRVRRTKVNNNGNAVARIWIMLGR